MKIIQNKWIKGLHDKPIITDIYYEENQTQKPLVIFCHGYKGFKDWGAWDLVAKAFAKQNLVFVKFNFSHNGGTIAQPIDFPDLEAFGHNNYNIELDDLQTVIDWLTADGFNLKEEVDISNITLIGHSRGGGIVTIKASEEPKITKVISWAGVSDYKSKFPDGSRLQQWKDSGIMHVINGRTNQQMPHYYQFYTSFIENEERLTISRATSKLNIPHLIIHGDKDPTVDVQEALKLHEWNPDSKLKIIEGADHVFGSKHPWETNILPDHLQKIVDLSINFVIN